MDTTTDVELLDITPEDSAVPIFQAQMEQIKEEIIWDTPDEMIASHVSAKESALTKLKKLGLSETEAKAVIGF